ncbi:MAG TPA: FAD-binding oxidoreductase [Rhizomicrobium sp.]|jgi:gamma-glutamylputrescine oxidase|nr:FAD-binding oxidoreductase [Rhizomicrobium sp.]
MTHNAPQGYYAASAADTTPLPALNSELRADICVIGGGFTGLSAALHAARAGAKVVLVEAQTIGFAASGRNGGQIHPGHRKEQAELEAWLGETHARDLWRLAKEARALVFDLAAEGCDLKRGLVIAAHNAGTARGLTADAEHLATHYGYRELRMLDHAKTSAMLGTPIYPGARLDGGGGHLHPLKFARALAQKSIAAGATIFEHSPAITIEDGAPATVRCAQGTIRADHIVLATDAFSGALAPRLAPYIAHVESFILATAPLGEALNAFVLPSDVAVADTRHVLDYYRKSADGRLLFAGRESYWNPPADIAALVRPRMLKVFPQLAATPIDYAWRGTVGITRTRMPHFGCLGGRTLFGHGYSGHGVALTMIGGKSLAEAALGNTERFDILARVPPRKFPGGALLRKPMVTAALIGLKLRDLL